MGVKHVEKFGFQGGMLAAGLGQEMAQAYVDEVKCGKLVVACVNSPSSVTLSGDLTAIQEIESSLKSDDIFTRRLRVPAAYHSHHMLPMADEYQRCLQQELGELGEIGSLKYYSPVTGAEIERASELGPEHWVRNSTQPVLFAQALQAMCKKPEENETPINIIVEIGPHGALAGPIRETINKFSSTSSGVLYGTCLTRNKDAVLTMHELACKLLESGCNLDLRAVNFPFGDQALSVLPLLPTYPWNHSTKYWREPRVNQEYRQRPRPQTSILGPRVVGLDSSTTIWRTFVGTEKMPWLADHRIQKQIVYPAAGYLCMAIEALHEVFAADQSTL